LSEEFSDIEDDAALADAASQDVAASQDDSFDTGISNKYS